MIDKVLDSFVPEQPCPKCGHPETKTRYRKDTSHRGCVTGGRLGTDRAGEHLERTCRRCRYRWEQLCVTPEDTTVVPIGSRSNE